MTQENGFEPMPPVPEQPVYGPPQQPGFVPVATQPEAPAPAPKSKTTLVLVIALVVCLAALAVGVLTGIGRGVITSMGPNVLQKASDTCKTGTLADKNKTLLFDMAGKEIGSGTGTLENLNCLLAATEVPTATNAKMMSTRALDGKQTDSWTTSDGTKLTALWSYHPDNGLDIIFQVED